MHKWGPGSPQLGVPRTQFGTQRSLVQIQSPRFVDPSVTSGHKRKAADRSGQAADHSRSLNPTVTARNKPRYGQSRTNVDTNGQELVQQLVQHAHRPCIDRFSGQLRVRRGSSSQRDEDGFNCLPVCPSAMRTACDRRSRDGDQKRCTRGPTRHVRQADAPSGSQGLRLVYQVSQVILSDQRHIAGDGHVWSPHRRARLGQQITYDAPCGGNRIRSRGPVKR